MFKNDVARTRSTVKSVLANPSIYLLRKPNRGYGSMRLWKAYVMSTKLQGSHDYNPRSLVPFVPEASSCLLGLTLSRGLVPGLHCRRSFDVNLSIPLIYLAPGDKILTA